MNLTELRETLETALDVISEAWPKIHDPAQTTMEMAAWVCCRRIESALEEIDGEIDFMSRRAQSGSVEMFDRIAAEIEATHAR